MSGADELTERLRAANEAKAAGRPWAKPRTKGRKRLEDRMAAAIDIEERARAKMRRTFRAWERAAASVARLSKAIDKFQVQS
jgi:uncharacterized membrane protein YidH (DUF202 family)